MAVPQHNTNLRRSGALLCEFADLILNGIGCDFEPGWSGARVWDGGRAYALAVALQATHFGGVVGSVGDVDGVACAGANPRCEVECDPKF